MSTGNTAPKVHSRREGLLATLAWTPAAEAQREARALVGPATGTGWDDALDAFFARHVSKPVLSGKGEPGVWTVFDLQEGQGFWILTHDEKGQGRGILTRSDLERLRAIAAEKNLI